MLFRSFVKANSYDIFRSTDNTTYTLLSPNQTGIQSVNDAGKLYYFDNTPEKGRYYYYKVRANNSTHSLVSALSTASGSLIIEGFVAPATFTATKDSNNNVTFTWSVVDYAKNYRIRYCDQATFDLYGPADDWYTYGTLFVDNLNKNTNTYFDESAFDLLAAGTYRFWITAVAENDQRATVSTKPSLTR